MSTKVDTERVRRLMIRPEFRGYIEDSQVAMFLSLVPVELEAVYHTLHARLDALEVTWSKEEIWAAINEATKKG